jgi:hypothetical protein
MIGLAIDSDWQFEALFHANSVLDRAGICNGSVLAGG